MIQKNNTPKIIIDSGGDKIVFNHLGVIHSNKRTIRSIYNNKIIVCNSEGEIYQQNKIATVQNKLVASITHNLIINEFFK